MCGIVGYLGPQSPKDIILSGLKKMEYRGYDSAGLAIFDQGELIRVRAEGKLENLEDRVKEKSFSGQIGIGHTRWATHGAPSERNAHPHMVGKICIVHNGIIENYSEIRRRLTDQGVELQSETDSELVAHLISIEIEKKGDLYRAVREVIPELQGAYSVLAIWQDEPDTMVAFSNGPPLIVGKGQGEYIVASDVQAIIPYTKDIIYLDEDEVAVVYKDSFVIYSANGFPIEKKVTSLNWSADLIEKQGYPHFMLKEIYEQPRAFAAAIDPHIDLETSTIRLHRDMERDMRLTDEDLSQIRRVLIIACGTSFYAGMYGKYLLEKWAHLPVEVDIASEFRYREPVLEDNTLVITISQSGETADTLAVLRQAKQLGAKVLSICNVEGSTIDREADGHLYLNSGPEIGVASTKAFIGMLGVLNVFSIFMGRLREKLSSYEEQEIVKELLVVPSQMDSVLSYDKFFAEASKTLKEFRGFLYMGRGVNFPISMEGALKLKELAYMHAEGYAAGEMKHGPLALVDDRMAIVMTVPDDNLYEKTISNLEEVRARGGQIIAIGSGENERLAELSEHYLSLPKASWNVNPILAVIPMQLMAYHLAESLGFDVDQPRNLAKSVTVE